MSAAADVLASLAELIRSGMPAPIAVSLSFKPYVTVHQSDLNLWVALLELPQPHWVTTGTTEQARWLSGTFDDKPFELGACRLAAKAVS